MPVIGGRQATVKSDNTKKETPGVKVVKLNKPKVEEEVKPVEEPKVEVTEETAVNNTTNSLSTIKPIKRKPHLNSAMLDQLSKSNISVDEFKSETITSKMDDIVDKPNSNGKPLDSNALVDMIVTRMDEEFVAKSELEPLVKTIVEKVLQEMLVEPNKKDNGKPKVIKQTKPTTTNSGTKPQIRVIGRKK